jgi:hypothetical protein
LLSFFFFLFFWPTAPRDREGEPRGGGVTVGWRLGLDETKMKLKDQMATREGGVNRSR